jgi:alkanesulfonate monooxygenase SsuD/methylene tetrahydromethanopterin reductase-like flavin-dependent oxidoreductase (luciferase family)
VKLDPERLRNILSLGTPDEVTESLRPVLDAGIEGFVFSLPDPYDAESVALAGEAVARAFD